LPEINFVNLCATIFFVRPSFSNQYKLVMKHVILPVSAILLMFAAGCEKTGTNHSGDMMITKNTEQLVRSDNEFGIELFKKVVNNNPSDKNVIISPVSAALALAMTYNGADGSTKDAMGFTLGKEGMEVSEINRFYKDLMEGLQSVDPEVTLDIANSIWYRNGFYVLPDFIQTNNSYFDAQVQALDFSSSSALETINGWVSDNTNEKITEILDEIPENAVMYLINAVYFLGTWKHEFEENSTTLQYFFPADKDPARVGMMKLEDTIRYLQQEIFDAIELPYGNGHYAMIVMLPDRNYTTSDIIEQLTTENWSHWIESFTEEVVVVNLPRFKFEFGEKLNDELTDMGMGVAFSPDQADFTKINPDGNLYISMVRQKAYVDVNEKGTEAAAITVVEILLTSAGPDGKIHFTANRPFLFAIMEKESKSIIFIGKVALPEYEL
jgi:serine protease inhibitor